MSYTQIIEKLPYAHPFLFVDELHHVDHEGVRGSCKFLENADFYKGHFKDRPVTPGVILTECCAQIGVVCLGIFLLQNEGNINNDLKSEIGLSSSEIEFYIPVFPKEKVTVSSKKIYFRFNKLKCEVKMHNAQGKLVCKGIIPGMFKKQKHE